MPISEILSDEAVLRLPPMLFGKIRWSKGLGGPTGNPCSGFTIFVEEHTVSQFRMGADGPEVIPGTGIWRVAIDSAPCWTAPDEDDMRVVRFNVPDAHLNGFPRRTIPHQTSANGQLGRITASDDARIQADRTNGFLCFSHQGSAYRLGGFRSRSTRLAFWAVWLKGSRHVSSSTH